AHGAYSSPPQMPHAQGINGPGDLRKDAFPHRPGHKAEHNRVAVAGGVFHNPVDDLQRGKGRFTGAAPAGKIVITVRPSLYIGMERDIYRRYMLAYVQAVQQGARLLALSLLYPCRPHP